MIFYIAMLINFIFTHKLNYGTKIPYGTVNLLHGVPEGETTGEGMKVANSLSARSLSP